MARGFVAGALLLTGCTLAVSLDGLSGGVAPQPQLTTDGGTADGSTSVVDAGDRDVETTVVEAGTTSRYAAAVLADTPSIYLRFGEAPGTVNVRTEVGTTTSTFTDGMTLGQPGALAGDTDTAIKFTRGILVLPPGVECAGDAACAIEMWVKIDAYPADYVWLVDHQLWDNRRGWLIEMYGTTFQYERWDNNTSTTTSTTEDLPLHSWHHLVAIRDAASQRIYLDGELRQTQVGAKVVPKIATAWTIGATACFSCADRQWFEGSIDEFAIYEHTLSEDRINAHLAAARAE